MVSNNFVCSFELFINDWIGSALKDLEFIVSKSKNGIDTFFESSYLAPDSSAKEIKFSGEASNTLCEVLSLPKGAIHRIFME